MRGNMKSYLSLIPISAKVKKKQNRMTILCIILSVFLVTSVFSMADMGIRLEETNAKQKHGNWHISLEGISSENAEKIAARTDVAAFSEYDAINYGIDEDYYIDGKRTAVVGTDEVFLTDIFDYMTEGRFPESENEAVISQNAGDVRGINIGDTVKLNTPAGDSEYKICGFFRDDGSADKYDAFIICMNSTAFERVRLANNDPPAPTYYCRFKKHTNIRRSIDEIREAFGLTDDNLGENLVMIGLSGFSENNVVQGMYSTAAFLFLLILMAGVLMIAGSMNSNIVGRTKFFGMLRCMGAGKDQITKFVRLEALYWCKTAVPTGVVSGTAITWALCAALKFGIGGEFSGLPLFRISLVGIICGISVGVITVLIAAQAPARRAARVSPIEAAADSSGAKNCHIPKGGHLRIETVLGISHAISSKKNLLLMTGSFAFSIILFLGFSAIHDWTGYALNGLQPHTPDLTIASDPLSCTVTRDLADKIGSAEGVKRVFGRSFKGDFPIEPFKGVGAVDLVSLDNQQFDWADEERWTGDKKGLERVYKEDCCVMTVYDKDNPFEKGDKIKLNGETLEIACVLTDSPIGGGGNPTVICTEKLFRRLSGETRYAVVDIQLEKNATENDIKAIRSETEASGFMLSDRRETNREVVSTYLAFTLLIYGFLSLIALISVFNIMNSISMSVSARMKQYGAMRSVGMSIGQLTKMISAETMTYTLCGLFCGLAAGLPIHKLFYESFITAYFGQAWEPPVFSAVVIVFFVIASSAAAIYAPSKRIRNLSVADTVHAD